MLVKVFWFLFLVNNFLIAGSGINFVKIRECFDFYKLCACISAFVHWEREGKIND